MELRKLTRRREVKAVGTARRSASRTSTASQIATAVGVVIAAGSLVAQAVQTYLENQQVGHERDEQNKRQARLINTWPAAPFSLDNMKVVVTNRSREPLFNFRVYITFARRDNEPVAIQTWNTFLPCTTVTFDLRALALSSSRTSRWLEAGKLPGFDYGLMFTDVSGQAWHVHAGAGNSQRSATRSCPRTCVSTISFRSMRRA